eukprot:CAMPEP_0182423930 /NCGR_PEP_ID=MMETSP1167-20130531/10036_1 /TAXON_ID=2988 /ORGANISM="Mallomonas Sp, Strain CCMP3275" /LENGTH=287 /DNA_ID=CAMNT_0024603317 /DNA_START=219 /DNA_END=1082 /DNA_ORIENTATION=+
MARYAYHNLSTDYFYRVNDDTELMTPWAEVFVRTLQSLSGSIGVVGPTCMDDNVFILTHDFTSRHHLDIFPSYYPVQLSDWFLDDWITCVYGKSRVFKATSVIVQHRAVHGTRYNVTYDNYEILSQLLNSTRQLLRQYMISNLSLSLSELALFDADPYQSELRDPELIYHQPTFSIDDIPSSVSLSLSLSLSSSIQRSEEEDKQKKEEKERNNMMVEKEREIIRENDIKSERDKKKESTRGKKKRDREIDRQKERGRGKQRGKGRSRNREINRADNKERETERLETR